jgi:hypothetical protein
MDKASGSQRELWAPCLKFRCANPLQTAASYVFWIGPRIGEEAKKVSVIGRNGDGRSAKDVFCDDIKARKTASLERCRGPMQCRNRVETDFCAHLGDRKPRPALA